VYYTYSVRQVDRIAMFFAYSNGVGTNVKLRESARRSVLFRNPVMLKS